MSDRETIIKGCENWVNNHKGENFLLTYSSIVELLALLKEQKHGHWILDPDGMDWNIPAWCCSVCGCKNDNIPPNLEKTNPLRWSGSKFCPNCGAKMDEEVKQDG